MEKKEAFTAYPGKDAGIRALPFVLGVIGGIGAGKSLVMNTLKEYGFCTLKTDDIARSFYRSGDPVFEKMKELLGKDIENEDGSAALPLIGERIFRDPALKSALEAIVHPAVWDRVRQEIGKNEADGVPTAVETALPDAVFFGLCDSVLCVSASPEVRRQRLMTDRGYSREKAEDLIRKQEAFLENYARADLMVDNSGTAEEIKHEIYKYCQQLWR